MIYTAIIVFLAVNASLRWLNNVTCLFVLLLLIKMEYTVAATAAATNPGNNM
jgi:hypothetical protein